MLIIIALALVINPIIRGGVGIKEQQPCNRESKANIDQLSEDLNSETSS